MPRRKIQDPRVPAKSRVHFVAQPNIREVNWNRDVPGNVQVPTAVRDRLTGLSMEHTETRKQLDILRQTRSQRTLEPLIVPPDLRQPVPISDAGVEQRGIPSEE